MSENGRLDNKTEYQIDKTREGGEYSTPSLVTNETIQDIAARIPEDDSHSVYCYNLNPAWYTYADLFPCIKYCGWQNHYFSLMPEVFEDFQVLFTDHPAIWFVLPVERGEMPQFLESEIANHYYLVYQNSKYMLFQYIENIVPRQ